MPISSSVRRPFFGVRIVLCFADGTSARMDFTNNTQGLDKMPPEILRNYAVGTMLATRCQNDDGTLDTRKMTHIAVLEIDRHGNVKRDPDEIVLRYEDDMEAPCNCSNPYCQV